MFPYRNFQGHLRNRKRNHASSSIPNLLPPQESNMNRSHKNLQQENEEEVKEIWLPLKSYMNRSQKNLDEEEKEGLQEESTPTKEDDELSIPEIIDIDEEDDDDMDLQLALFSSCNVEKDTQIIDLKQKGILSSSALISSPRFLKFYQIGESSVTACVICKETMSSGEVLRTNDNCRHPFCEDCIKNYIGEKLQEDMYEVKCPEEKCKQVLETSFWLQYVPNRLYWLMMDARIEGSVLQYPMVFCCPHEDCEKMIVNDERRFLIRACPNCWKLYCAGCMAPIWHKGKTCTEYKTWKEERLIAQLEAALWQRFLSHPSLFFPL